MSLRTEKKLVGEVSMEEPLGRDREGNERTVLDLVGTDGEEIFETVRKSLEGERLRALMDWTLKKREKLVLSLRCGMDGAAPLGGGAGGKPWKKRLVIYGTPCYNILTYWVGLCRRRTTAI